MIFKIAFRNVFRQRRRSLLTALTMFGGFTLSAVSIGWSDGTYNRMIDLFTRNRLGQIQLHRAGYLDRASLYKTIACYQQWGDTLKKDSRVEHWAPRLYSAGLVSLGDKSIAVRITGIQPALEDSTTRFHKKIVTGRLFSAENHHVILGKGLAELLKAAVGDTVVLLSQAADGSLANDLFPVIGLMESGDEIADRSVLYLPLHAAQSFLMLPDQVHEIAVTLHHLNDVKKVLSRLRLSLKGTGIEADSWREFAKSFYQAMQADKQGMWIMIVVIMLIVAVGVLNTVLMSVLERTREYGMLKAVGTSPKAIFLQVVTEVQVLIFFSLVFGTLLALIANTLLSVHGFNLPQPFTYGGIEFKKMVAEVNARSFYLSGLTVAVSASLISLFPAWRAARIDPAKAMRMI
jgi:putative ABC transport system permease protein